MLIAFATAMLWFVALSRLRIRTLKPAPNSFVLGPREIFVSYDGIRETSHLHDYLFRWPVVRGVEAAGVHLFVLTDRNSAIIVPQRSFASTGDREQFAKEIQAKSVAIVT